MMEKFNGDGGVLVQFGVRFEAAVQVVVCCTESLLSPLDRFTLELFKRLVERPKRESESSESPESSESLVLESTSKLITGFRNGGG